MSTTTTYIETHCHLDSLKEVSLEETLKTLHCQGIDLCIIRTNISEQLAQFKEKPPIKIINGGDGTHQHPTQALLDLFTMQEIGLELAGKASDAANAMSLVQRLGEYLQSLDIRYEAM